MTPGLRAALREYNAGRFFECHEALEDLLDETDGADWDFMLGLIQVAVGYHKLTSRHPGGDRLLAMGLEKLAPYAPDHGGVDLAALRRGVQADLARLADAQAAGRAQPAPLPPRLLPARGRA